MKTFKTIPASNKLTDADIAGIEEAVYHMLLNKMKLVNRMFYIYSCIAKIVGVRVRSWKLEAYQLDKIDEEDIDNLDFHLFDNVFGGIDSTKTTALIKFDSRSNENNHDFSSGFFPARWLFEDFEDELQNGFQKYRDNLKKQLEQEQKIEQNRESVIKQIKKKLTPEEIEVLWG
jgi:hypothetical protein